MEISKRTCCFNYSLRLRNTPAADVGENEDFPPCSHFARVDSLESSKPPYHVQTISSDSGMLAFILCVSFCSHIAVRVVIADVFLLEFKKGRVECFNMKYVYCKLLTENIYRISCFFLFLVFYEGIRTSGR